MKIVFVLDCYNVLTNGTTATAVRFASELRALGHEVRILGCESEKDKDDKDYYGMKHYDFPVFEPLIVKEGFSFSQARDYKTMCQAIKGADVVHIFLPFRLENKARLIAEAYHVPVTAAFHLQPDNITSAIGLGHFSFLNNCIYLGFKNVTYRYVRHVHCPSEMIQDQLKKHHYDNKTHVISNGVNLDFFHPIDSEKPKEYKERFVITMTGRLAGEKRQDLIIKAIGKSKYNSKIQLILSGQGPYLQHYKKLIKRCKLVNPPVMEFKSQDELRKLLNYCDLYVHASDAEIEGIGAIEAFACGAVPVISDSKLSATNYFALDEHCLFKAGSYKSLRSRIDFFIEHPELKKELSQRYIKYAQGFGLEKQVKMMEDMFAQAIDDHENGLDALPRKLMRKEKKKKLKIYKKLIKQVTPEEGKTLLAGADFAS